MEYPADMIQEYRTKINLAAEKLTQLVEPSSDIKGGKVASQAAFTSYLGAASKKFQKEDSEKYLTEPEELARRSYDAMNLILQDACDRERWADQKFQDRLDSYNKDLCYSLEEQLLLVDTLKGLVPALGSTLHALYTAYEIGKTATKFANYLSSQGKDIHESQVEANKKIVEVAQHLLEGVSEKSAVIKKGLDEGGWIDKVLDSVLQGPDGTGTTVPGELRDMVDEAHLEIWAGDVVESWKDSTVGLSYLKP
jgi:N-terminal acetyltransferase B complex non-catalytic subunit